jgi:GGDEF domain-containing protein
MALMSGRRYLTPLEEEAAFRRVVSMLLDGVATNAMNLDPEVFAGFGRQLGGLRQAMASETTVESLMSHAAAAVLAIGDYAKETNRLLHTQTEEMQNTIASLSGESADAGGDEGATPAMQGASSLRARLDKNSGGAHQGGARQKEGLDQLAQALSPEATRKQEPSRSLDLDPVTQLPCEAAARAHFLSAVNSGELRHVVVFVLGSAQRINLRFGRATGDEVVRELKRYVAAQLQSGDRMFRWAGPAVVALLASTEPFDRIRSRMKRFLEKPIERDFDVNGRSVLIPLSIAWSVFPLSLPLAGVNRQIHDFIAGQGYRDEDPIPA